MTSYKLPDVDIDFKDRDDAIRLLGGIPAAIIKDNKARKHNTGMYYTNIPTDPSTGCASIDHEAAENRGYFKLDFLNLGVYDHVRDEEHLDKLIATEPNWERLWTDSEFVSKLIHISGYFNLLQQKRPKSVVQMAMFLAIIRPGKKHLQQKEWNVIEHTVWDMNEDTGYAFKHAHAISYAMVVQVNMNLIEEQENEMD